MCKQFISKIKEIDDEKGEIKRDIQNLFCVNEDVICNFKKM